MPSGVLCPGVGGLAPGIGATALAGATGACPAWRTGVELAGGVAGAPESASRMERVSAGDTRWMGSDESAGEWAAVTGTLAGAAGARGACVCCAGTIAASPACGALAGAIGAGMADCAGDVPRGA